MSQTKSQKVRSQLKHQVVDSDGHWLELHPVYADYLADVGGAKAVDQYRAAVKNAPGYGGGRLLTPEMRMVNRVRKQGWWTQPVNARDRAAYTLPKLMHQSLDEWGIDVALIYPTIGFLLLKLIQDRDLRQVIVRAFNTMAMDMFKPYGDRLIPSGIISLDSPDEALAQLDDAHKLGLKLLVMNGTAQRPIEGDAGIPVDKRRYYFDAYGLDSPYNYDPVWQKLVDIKCALTVHTGTMGWPDRSSPTSFVYNHMGHFAQSHHLTARALFMGGVTQRFPTLKVGFLEGGVGWACNLYGDIIGHWKKRNRKYMEKHHNPLNLDRALMRRLMEESTAGDKHFAGKFDDIFSRNLDVSEPDLSAQEQYDRDKDSDDFYGVKIDSVEDIRRLFTSNFYFGCEADDPMNVMAFNAAAGLKVKAMMGSDIAHFDVPDPGEVLEEAWEMVEHRLISESDFREFTLTNAVELHASMNPDFYKGTIVEAAAKEEMKLAGQRDFVKLKHAA
jgi:predicted TIM-barrel fold metal-dependent hydrolase